MNDQHFQTNREENGLVWFSAPRLNANGGAVHGFSSRLGGVSRGYLTSLNLGTSRGDQIEHVRENFRRYGEAVGFDSTKTVFSDVYKRQLKCTLQIQVKSKIPKIQYKLWQRRYSRVMGIR